MDVKANEVQGGVKTKLDFCHIKTTPLINISQWCMLMISLKPFILCIPFVLGRLCPKTSVLITVLVYRL